MKIAVRIDRLVLDGLPVTPGEAQRVRTAVEAEMTRLLARGGPRHFTAGAAPAVAAPGMELRGSETPSVLGTRIARSVHAALQPETGRHR